MAYDGLLVLKKAVDTAGSTDSEKVSKALDGLKWTSLRGERYIRAEDHMANVGIYVGVTAKDPKFKDFLVLKDVVEVPAEKVWMSVDEIKALRANESTITHNSPGFHFSIGLPGEFQAAISMNLQFMLFILINGLSQGMVLFIIASGLSLVFGVLRVINFAHGSLYMIGAFMAFSLSSLFAGKTLFAFLMLMLLVPPGVAILGLGLEVSLFRRIYRKEHLLQLLLTYSLVLILDGLTRLIWGGQIRNVPRPEVLAGSLDLFGLYFPSYNLFLLIVGPLLAAGLWVSAVSQPGRQLYPGRGHLPGNAGRPGGQCPPGHDLDVHAGMFSGRARGGVHVGPGQYRPEHRHGADH